MFEKVTQVVALLAGLVISITLASPPLQEYDSDFSDFKQFKVTDRLPLSILPNLYRLEIRPILDEGNTGTLFTSPGKIWITGVANASVSSITVNYVNINITTSTVTVTEDSTNSLVGVTGHTLEPEKEFYTINLARPLTPGLNYTVYIEFTSKINEDASTGLYRTSYTNDDGTITYVAATDFQAPDARMAFPCLDEPQLKASWDIEIIRLTKYHSLSNMDLDRTETDVPGLTGWVKDIYRRTVPMSSYLICFAVSDYLSVTADTSLYNRPVVIWGPPPMINQGQGNFSPDVSAKLMKFFEDHYMVQYSLPKMDKIALPDYSAGAMENWGLNTYRLSRLLYEEGVSTIQELVSMTNTISHEVVHQWFGNLITADWWNDLWIQEGAATYYAPVGVAGIGMSDQLPMETLITATVQRSFLFDASPATHPIHNVGVDPSEVPVLFDTLTYHKGASLIRMMVSALTEPVYQSAMTQVLQRFAYTNLNQDDLFDTIDEVVGSFPPGQLMPRGVSVKAMMHTWTLQSGFPVLTVERNSMSDPTVFTQSRFVRDVSTIPSNETWVIPISLFRPSDSTVVTRPVAWLLNNQTSTSLTIRDEWFIVNPQTAGYYRVLYKNQLLDRIIDQLFINHTVFDSQTRSAFIDDNLNLAFSGYLELSKALNLTLYLQNERELFPWVSFVTNMATPYRMLSRSSAFPAFKKYIIELMNDTLTQINIEPQATDAIGTHLLRTRLVEWTCNHGHSDCINFAKAKFAAWMANPSNTSIVFPDLQPSVYCTAVANGGDAEWEFVLSQYKVATRDTSQLNLLRALGCSKTSFRLNNLLDLALDRNSGIRENQRVIGMQAVAGNSAGVDLAFNFIRNNYDTILRRYGAGIVRSVISTLATNLNQIYDKTDLEAFITSKPDLSGSSLAALDDNINWMSRHSAHFINFLATQNNP